MEIVFIISSPAREENVGAAARAIKTMGINGLRLVNPLCNHLGERARATAHGAADILERAVVFDSLEKAREDIPFLAGTAAKKRNIREDRHPLEILPGILLSKSGMLEKAGVVFGGEESGLSNREIDTCDILTTIPMAGRYPSLNLAQAVMLYAYTLSEISLGLKQKQQRKASLPELKVVKGKALQLLDDVGLPGDHIIHRRIMERLMMLDREDMHLFHSFCKF